MDLEMSGRVAIITGSTHGIGKAIADSLAQEGVDVIICGRHEDSLLKTKIELEKYETKIYTANVDVIRLSQIQNIFESIIKPIGRLDILVNNVGGTKQLAKFSELSDEEWTDAIELNLMSMVRFSREAIPWLKKSSYPRIINISSLSGHQPGSFNPHYAVAKAGVISLSKCLANDLAEYDILVNSICPSTISGGNWDYNIIDRAHRENISTEEAERIMLQEENRKTPLRRIGTVEDVAHLTTFLASGKANYINGECIDIDGSISRSIL